nr:hypothetical protein [Rhodoferax sp.]
MNGPTCNELGFCQALAECPQGVVQDLAECHLSCSGPTGPNRFPFAPGVIEGPVPGTDDGWVAEIVVLVIALAAVVAAIGFATGYLSPGAL